MDRDLGKVGERIAAAWCSNTGGMVVNQSDDEDKRGWDLLVEFTLKDEETEVAGAPPDRDFREVKSFIQVRSKNSQYGRVSLKVSNWEYLATGTLDPTFVLVLEFDEKERPQRAFLIHVGAEIIEQVLRRIRKLLGEGTQLHEEEMSVRYGEEERLEDESGRAIRAVIVQSIEGNPLQYRTRKRRYLTEIGYEGAALHVQGHAEVPSDYEGSPEDFIADLSVGLEPSLDLEVDEAKDLRFDDPAAISSFPDRINVKPDHETEKVKLIFSTGRYNREQVRTDWYVPGELMSEVPAEKRKFRFSLPHADIVLAGGYNPFSLKIDLPPDKKPVSLSSLQPLARLILFLRDASEDEQQFKITLRNPSKSPSEVEWGVFHGGNIQVGENLGVAAERNRNTWKVWKDADAQNRVEMSLSHLLEYWVVYEGLAKALRGRERPFYIEYGCQPSYEEALETSTPRVAVPQHFVLRTATHILVFGIVLTGEPTFEGEKEELYHYSLRPEETEVVYRGVFGKGEAIPFGSEMEIRELCAERVSETDAYVQMLEPAEDYEIDAH